MRGKTIMKKGVNESLKSEAVNIIECEIRKELDKPHKTIDREQLIAPYLKTLEHIFRHMEHRIECVHNGFYEGYIFIAWLENNKLFMHIIRL